jgi:uncharacterized protein YdhG (YjbR/CyaY superfamily)
MSASKPANVDEYISRFPGPVRTVLEQIRSIVREISPDATEAISYGIPTFNLNGTYLIYFAAYKKHIGIYPVPARIEDIGKEFTRYKTSGKGTLQIPLGEAFPTRLIAKLVKFKVRENKKRAVEKTLPRRKDKSAQISKR